MQLPTDTRAGAGYAAAPVTVRGTADGAGSCTLTVGPVPQGYRWRLNYLTVTTTSAAVAAVTLYVDRAELPNILDGTALDVAVAVYNPPRVIEQGQSLVVVWSGVAAGAHCSARVEYDVEPA